MDQVSGAHAGLIRVWGAGAGLPSTQDSRCMFAIMQDEAQFVDQESTSP